MIIVASGDSFIWGSELKDSPHGGPFGWSSNTFPALLSRDYKYCCAAYPGNSNQDIANSVITTCKEFQSAIVLVCWTWSTRDNEPDSDIHIQRTETFLKDQGILYLFTCADNCIITGKLDYTNWFFFPPGIEPYETTEPRGFYQWAVENKYPTGIEGHPLEQAHIDAAELMQHRFNNLIKEYTFNELAKKSL